MAASPLAAAMLGGEGGGAGLAAFTDPAIAQATPDLQMAQQLLQNGLSTAPAGPWQALARVAQTAAGGVMQQRAMGTLAQAYAHTADSMADTLVPNTPLWKALKSDDPLTKMQGIQAYQKVMVLRSQPETLSPGQERFEGGQPTASNTRPRSELGIQQEDLDNAGKGPGASAPAATPPAAPVGRPGVPLNPPRFQPGGIESVIGMSPPQPAPAAGNPSAPSFNDRFAAARPSGVPSTSPPTSPLQGAIDTKAAADAAKTAATEQAKAGVEYGDLLKPQPAPPKGPGGTEALTTTHGTLVPPLTDQGTLPKTPAEAKPFVETSRKTIDGWNSGLQPGYQAEQRLQTIANVFKTMQTGYGTEAKAHVASMLKSIGINLPEGVLSDPGKVETAIHENYVETLQQLKATTPRFTQMEFRALSENKEHPDLRPEANLQMLSEDIGQLRQSRDLPRDWVEAQRHGWRDPQSFEQAWLRQNPLSGYVGSVRKEIGPLKGMAPDQVVGGTTAAATAGPAVGYEHNGYRFKGGDPNKQASWEKIGP